MFKIHCDRDGCSNSVALSEAPTAHYGPAPLPFGWAELKSVEVNREQQAKNEKAVAAMQSFGRAVEGAPGGEFLTSLMEAAPLGLPAITVPVVETTHLCPACTQRVREVL